MANYYLDFVGLNTFIYEVVGFDPDNQFATIVGTPVSKNEAVTIGSNNNVLLNHIGGVVDNTPTFNIKGNQFNKNFLFSHNLPDPTTGLAASSAAAKLRATASFFPALMLHRNGPYGHPTWKQIRASHNPLIRKQVKNSIFTHVVEPGDTILFQGSNINKRYGSINKYIEVPVVSRFKALEIRAAGTDGLPLQLKTSLGNSVCHFNNIELDRYYGFDGCGNQEYDSVKRLYANGGLDNPKSPLNQFDYLIYAETIFPTQVYTNKNYTRQRTTFSFNWRDAFTDRERKDVDNGFGSTITSQSIWPLDYDTDLGNSGTSNRRTSYYGYKNDDYSNGILQNNYNQISEFTSSFRVKANVNNELRPAPIYSRKHTLTPSASCVSPNGMKIEDVNYGSPTNLNATQDIPSGEAKWEAGDQAGKNPFYDSYDEYVQGVRQKGKGYTIVPEFRISNHIPSIVSEGLDKKFTNMFELTGGLSSADGSDEDNFYKIYSTSEFLKHFDLVREDHKNFVDPKTIKLKCKAIKKFLPYNGFYPCQRTVEIAEQFYSSYSDSVTTDSTAGFDPYASSIKHGLQNLITPLFAPGTLFNSIKSGVACDYPITTGSVTQANNRILKDGDNYYLQSANTTAASTTPIFEKRIPFAALVEPSRYLSQQQLYNNEPHTGSETGVSCFWDGTGDNLYKMMAHNFLAEVPDFFLQGQQFSSIYSLPSNNPKVGNAISGSVYKMRIKMYKTSLTPSGPALSSSAGRDQFFTQPQYADGTFESFTMYSRPSAFGPPSRSQHGSAPSGYTGSNSDAGENYPFTPPYYHGQAWADIKFTATEDKKYTIDEIIRNCEVKYWRYIDDDYNRDPLLTAFANLKTERYNIDAMQLSASVNLFAQGEIKSVDLLDDSTSDKVNVAVDVSSDNKSRWIIQPYFETPMLNFNHLSASNAITLPTKGKQATPRGMWHQYGRIETDTSKGVFMEVTDIPDRFRDQISGSFSDKSLKKLCGFTAKGPIRLGQVAQSKIISEAVVAIPFIEEEGQRKFFKIDPGTINFAKQARSMAGEGSVGKSVLHMVDMMRKFVIPPSLDFVHREDIDPFAMYIFEFKHTLSQQDLADIWQNLPPTIGKSFEEAEASISHDLLAHELLGGGETIIQGKIKKGPSLPDRVKWMVFKAKQRAETNYYNKIVGEQDTTVAGTNKKDFTTRRLAREAASILRPEGVDVDMSYNWPYDFFSLIELVKLDAEVTLADTEITREEDTDIVPKKALPKKIEELNTKTLGRGRR